MNTSSKWVLLSFAMGTGRGREVQEPAPGLPGRRKARRHLGGHLAPSLLHGPLCPLPQRNRGLAFHDHFAHFYRLAEPLASARKAACLLLAMPGKASEAVVWPLSDCGGSEETSLHTAGKPRRSAGPGAGRSREAGPQGVGLGIVIDPSPECLQPHGPGAAFSTSL